MTDNQGTYSGNALGRYPRYGWLLLFELAALVALTVLDQQGYIPLSRVPFLLLLCWISLRLRKLKWGDIGLKHPAKWSSAIAIGIVAGIVIELFAIHVTTPLIASVSGVPLDLSDFQDLVGNLNLLLIFLALNWVLAAFGEELAFRGYLMNRFADVFNRSRFAWFASLIVISVFFGYGHAYQGLSGLIQESLSGFWLGVLFLVFGRNLTIPIIAHGVSNTLALILIYFNQYPGLA